jgi:hypothetical protein
MAFLKKLFSKKQKTRLPGSRPEHEIIREVERDLQKWRDEAMLFTPW